ncbi:MAG TPA: hypothetical protein VF898_06745 [Chloroflexota bacterium]
MALILDERARAVIASRRARGKDDRVYLRFERSSIRSGVAWVVAVGWSPRRLPEGAIVVQNVGGTEVHVDRRLARYAKSRDLTISGARLGPWQWLAMADPFAYEHVREWELAHPDVSPPPRRVPYADQVTGRELASASVSVPTRLASAKDEVARADSPPDSDVTTSNIRPPTDEKRLNL